VLGHVLALAEKEKRNKNCGGSIFPHVCFRGTSTLASRILAGNSRYISGGCDDRYDLHMVGFSPLCFGLSNRLALDARYRLRKEAQKQDKYKGEGMRKKKN